MTRDPRFDVLFEPIKIGPVTAKNRFYQVPHCTGVGHRLPRAHAALREVKAEGGWAVVNTELCSVHPTGELWPFPESRLWNDDDERAFNLLTESIHRHGALAGCELGLTGLTMANAYSREVPLAPSNQPNAHTTAPIHARAMDKSDIRRAREWHRNAVLRAKRAGFDVIYVYAAHEQALPMHFLQRRRNNRIDEYGGSLENRTRFLRELIEDTKDAVGDTCAVAVRIAVDELIGDEGITCENEGRDVIEMLAELPDLWDVNISGWANDSASSRFAQESFQEKYVSFVKKVTTKPVVGVGRFTSPETMLSQVKRGILDFIGAARPSIADPFLPKKIEEGRFDDIRECIGSNHCIVSELAFCAPHRCTQNPTAGEEWRRGWHPEYIGSKTSDDPILVVGAGPAGLECARALGQRGYPVHLAEGSKELGGRVKEESSLPGLGEYVRVSDYRRYQIEKLSNIQVYMDSKLSADDIIEFGAPNVVIATGSLWRKDGIGRTNLRAIPGFDLPHVVSANDIMNGASVKGPCIVFDDDLYYLGSAISEQLAQQGHEVVLVSPAAEISSHTRFSLEQGAIQARILKMGIQFVASHNLLSISSDHVELSCLHTGRKKSVQCSSVVMVTSREVRQDVYKDLLKRTEEQDCGSVASIKCIGDCLAPATIADALFSGHQYARELGEPESKLKVLDEALVFESSEKLREE